MQETSRNYAELPRNLIEEDCFRERLHDLRLRHQTLDEIFEKLAPALGRTPEIYPGEEGVHRALILAGVNHPELRLWFQFDADNVYLIDVETTQGGR